MTYIVIDVTTIPEDEDFLGLQVYRFEDHEETTKFTDVLEANRGHHGGTVRVVDTACGVVVDPHRGLSNNYLSLGFDDPDQVELWEDD